MPKGSARCDSSCASLSIASKVELEWHCAWRQLVQLERLQVRGRCGIGANPPVSSHRRSRLWMTIEPWCDSSHWAQKKIPPGAQSLQRDSAGLLQLEHPGFSSVPSPPREMPHAECLVSITRDFALSRETLASAICRRRRCNSEPNPTFPLPPDLLLEGIKEDSTTISSS